VAKFKVDKVLQKQIILIENLNKKNDLLKQLFSKYLTVRKIKKINYAENLLSLIIIILKMQKILGPQSVNIY
jgi:hypothetical protein